MLHVELNHIPLLNSAETDSPREEAPNLAKGALAFWAAKEAKNPLLINRVSPIKKEYINKESLMLEPISSYSKDEIVEIRGYALVVEEYLKYQENKEGDFVNPYTQEKLSEEEKTKILKHPRGAAWTAEMANREKRRPKDISEKTLMQLKNFATVLASYGKSMDEVEIGDKEFAEKGEAAALTEFEEYYQHLPPKERKALDSCKIGYFTFETTYNELQNNQVCRQIVAMGLWKLLGKHGPHLLPAEVLEAVKHNNEQFLHDYVPKK